MPQRTGTSLFILTGIFTFFTVCSCLGVGSLSGASTFIDPFQYCRIVGTIDSPDGLYIGEAPPAAVVQGLREKLGLPKDTPDEIIARGMFWRCMDGKVMACFTGANLPCMTKADADRNPSDAMAGFCKANPASDMIPAAVTGRATVYQWRCRDGAPQIVRQVAEHDGRGFLSNIWFELVPQQR
jgi:hypothetical protein